PNQLNSTYAISLQTMALAVAGDERDRQRIAENVRWLEQAQVKPKNGGFWPGSWSYSTSDHGRPGDNSNSQYALLRLAAAGDAGVQVEPVAWLLARAHWERGQKRDGGWTYTPAAKVETASMTCAGITSLAAARARATAEKGEEVLDGDAIHGCGARAGSE